MLNVAENQHEMLSRLKEKTQNVDEATYRFITPLYTKQQTNRDTYKMQCYQWREEKLTSRQKKVIEKLEAKIYALEKINHQILFLSNHLRQSNLKHLGVVAVGDMF
jgi:hypothetical protein